MKFLTKKKTILFKTKSISNFFLLRYYLSLDDLKAPIEQLKIVPIKGFEFFKTLNYFQIKSIGEKIQLLSYYYVSEDSEKENLNTMFEKETKKNTATKIEHIHNDYALDKITGFSFNHSERTDPYNFNFDVDDFKEVFSTALRTKKITLFLLKNN